jgi:hypothetical protein
VRKRGSDVNLATQLLIDTYERNCARAAVISNDSDLARPIEVAAAKLSHRVIVFNPHPGGTARRLKKVATEYRAISDKVLQATVFPDVVSDGQVRFTSPPSGNCATVMFGFERTPACSVGTK